MQRKCFKKF